MTVCALDTDVVIAALDRADAHHAAAARAFARWHGNEASLLLSLINYAEVLVRPATDPGSLETAVTAIAALGIELDAPTPQIARDAATLRQGVSLADGFALATARAHGAGLASFDHRVRRAARGAGLDVPALR